MQSVVQIVMIGALTAVAIVYMTTKYATGSKIAGQLERRLREMEEALANLDRRLKNVETITTSKSFDLESEFDSLKKD